MEGAYRLLGEHEGLVETFVAAPGPMGWRYFGRVLREGTEDHVASIDFVVDRAWNLVRFRLIGSGGEEAVATPGAGGLDVSLRGPGREGAEGVPEAVAVWSASPCSLLVVDRMLGESRSASVAAAHILAPDRVEPVTITLERLGSELIPTSSGTGRAERIAVGAGQWRSEALILDGVPLRAQGWFEAIA